ncbi:hypothetical protein J6590_078654 [Homalodisca vitripennis]|nr:hypothetical protein J6590_078653 [Homalodisca vitripennis]KAG8241802.1 hypothetical protein J6590_078654 [Homalodisca vitripennis]
MLKQKGYIVLIVKGYNRPAIQELHAAIMKVSRPPRDTSYAAPLPTCLTSPSYLHKLGNIELEFSVTGQQTTSRHVICSAPAYLSDVTITLTQTWKYRTGLLSDRSADHLETRLIQRACLPVSRPPRDTSYATGLPTCLMSPSLTQTWKYRTGLLSDRSTDHLRHVINGLPTCRVTIITLGNTELEFSVTGQQTTSRHVSRPPRDTSYAAPLPTCLTSPSLTYTWKYRTRVLSDRSADHLETRHMQRPCLPTTSRHVICSAPAYLSDVTIAYIHLEYELEFSGGNIELEFSVTGQQTTSRHVLCSAPAYLSDVSRPPRDTSYAAPLPTCLTSPSYLHIVGNTELEFSVTGQQTTLRHVICSAPAYLCDVTIILTHSWKYRTGVLSDRSADHLETMTGQQTTLRHVICSAPAYLCDVTIIFTHSRKYRFGVLCDRSADHLETRHMQRPCLPV